MGACVSCVGVEVLAITCWVLLEVATGVTSEATLPGVDGKIEIIIDAPINPTATKA